MTELDIDLQLTPVDSACNQLTLIKASLSTVYWCGVDGYRYVFPNEKTYFSWFTNFDNVTTIGDNALAAIPLGRNVTYRAGTRMIKVMTDPRVYNVESHGVLRWVEEEAVAFALFGAAWNTLIHDLPDPFFINYGLGRPVASSDVPSSALPVAPLCASDTTFTEFLTLGSSNVEVRPLQELLLCLGYFSADFSPSGYFGEQTEAAVQAFQTGHGIDPAGFVGPSTREALNAY